MTRSARFKLAAVTLEVIAVLLFLIAYNATTWNSDGVMALALACASGGAFATFGADE